MMKNGGKIPLPDSKCSHKLKNTRKQYSSILTNINFSFKTYAAVQYSFAQNLMTLKFCSLDSTSSSNI